MLQEDRAGILDDLLDAGRVKDEVEGGHVTCKEQVVYNAIKRKKSLKETFGLSLPPGPICALAVYSIHFATMSLESSVTAAPTSAAPPHRRRQPTRMRQKRFQDALSETSLTIWASRAGSEVSRAASKTLGLGDKKNNREGREIMHGLAPQSVRGRIKGCLFLNKLTKKEKK